MRIYVSVTLLRYLITVLIFLIFLGNALKSLTPSKAFSLGDQFRCGTFSSRGVS